MKLTLAQSMDVTPEQRIEWQMPTPEEGELVRSFALCDYGIEMNAGIFSSGTVDVWATHGLDRNEVYSTTLFDLIMDDVEGFPEDIEEYAEMLEATAKRLRAAANLNRT